MPLVYSHAPVLPYMVIWQVVSFNVRSTDSTITESRGRWEHPLSV